MPGWNYVVDLVVYLITALHNVVGSWGIAIILFTVLMKVVTFPLTSQQIRSSKAMAELQPRMKEIQEQFKNDKERQTQETLKLYQELGVNPLSGCLPLLIQLPIWIALYNAITNLAVGGQMGGFWVIPNLSCPAQDNPLCGVAGTGPGWVLQFGALAETWPYLVLVVLTVVTQILLTRVMTASRPAQPQKVGTKPTEQDATMQAMSQMNLIMPFMFGFFALTYPAGLSLYWVTNNVLTFVQYFILNRMHNTPNLAAASATGGTVEIEVAPKYSEGGKNDQARRKRKKR
jgi:YidC/Oxa1 family membrane protein insertase